MKTGDRGSGTRRSDCWGEESPPMVGCSCAASCSGKCSCRCCIRCFPSCSWRVSDLKGAESELLAIRLHIRLGLRLLFRRGKVPCFWAHLRGMNLAERYPPTLELGHAWAIHAPVMSLIPWLRRGEAYREKVTRNTQGLGDVCGQGQSLHYWGVVLFVGARFDECISKCREAVRLLERTGDFWERNMARWQSANSVYRKGDLPRAITEAKQLYEACTRWETTRCRDSFSTSGRGLRAGDCRPTLSSEKCKRNGTMSRRPPRSCWRKRCVWSDRATWTRRLRS